MSRPRTVTGAFGDAMIMVRQAHHPCLPAGKAERSRRRSRDCTLKCADYVEYVLGKEGDVAAVIAETVRSTSIIPPSAYWEKIRAACDKYGALLILDEIPHCLGRTGKMFTCQHFEVVPDMLVVGKGLGGGIFPLAALIARQDLDIMPDRALGLYP